MKTLMQTLLRSAFRFYRLAYVIFSFVGLVVLLWFQFSINSHELFPTLVILQLLGTLATIAGLVIMIIMIRKYFMQLSGLRWLASNHFKTRLEVSGLHKYVRHPLYLGTFLFIWGWFLWMPVFSLFIANSIITAYTLIALRFEEEKLVAEFGEDYKIYRQKVPGLIPRF